MNKGTIDITVGLATIGSAVTLAQVASVMTILAAAAGTALSLIRIYFFFKNRKKDSDK